MRNYFFLLAALIFWQSGFSQPANTNISNGVLFDGEPYLAINPTNHQNLVAAWMGLKFSGGGFHVAIKTRASFDGGSTWSTANSMPHFGSAYGSADVSMAFNSSGLLYICYIDYQQSPDSGGVWVARSADGGLTWDTSSKAIDIYDDPTKRPVDRPWLVVDNSTTANSGTLYITTKPASWINPPNRNYYKVSTDGGFTWSTLANVDGGNFLVGNAIPAPMAAPATTTNGHFCAAYPSYVASQNFLPALYLATSANQGQSFNYTTIYSALPATLDTNMKNGYQLIASPIDSSKMIFLSPMGINGDGDIFAIQSSDGGQSFNAPVRVNDDAIGNAKAQDMVWASYNDLGNVAVTWRDRRNAATNGFWNVDYDFYYSLSNDNGQSFSTNQKLSSIFIPFDSVLAQNGNDFMSCVYSGDTLYSVWGDTRNGIMNIYFSKTQASINTSIGVAVLDGDELPIMVFPNPVTNTLKITSGTELIGTTLYITSIDGKLIRSFTAGNHNEMDVSFLSPGIYLIKSNAKGSEKYVRFIKS